MRNLLIASVGLFLSSQAASAQVLTNGDIERGLSFGAHQPYDGIPWPQRYNYGTSAFFYPFGSSKNLYVMDYYDKLERAEKFGYAPPPDPFAPRVPSAQPAPVGFGFGLFRWRR